MTVQLVLYIKSARQTLTGWRYFWAKRVSGFNPAVHCARCLIGPYEKRIGTLTPVNQPVRLDGYRAGEILYLCGVSSPYRWADNMHLAVKVTGNPEDSAAVTCFNGDTVALSGAVAIPIDDKAAKGEFPHLGADYLTCRNFQFGAAMQAQGLLPAR